MADDEPKQKRFRERDDPFKDDDPSDDSPRHRRVASGDGPPILFLLALIFGVLAVTASCGGSGWWVFANVLRGGGAGGGSGGGWTLFGVNEVRITSATRAAGFFGPNAGPQIAWAAVTTADVSTDLTQYFIIMNGGGVTIAEPFPMAPLKGTNISQSLPRPQFRNVPGPIDVWVEKRTNPNASGKRVSNTFTIR